MVRCTSCGYAESPEHYKKYAAIRHRVMNPNRYSLNAKYFMNALSKQLIPDIVDYRVILSELDVGCGE